MNQLNKKYSQKKIRGVYARYEKDFPRHAIIMKEGYFYSAHNNSALVLNRVLDYALGKDAFGRLSTGCPVYEKIANALQEEGVSFILVESGELVERFDGDDPFQKYGISEETVKELPPAEKTNEDSTKPKRTVYPQNLLKALYGMSQTAYPLDVEGRIKTVLDSEVLFPGRYSRDAECVRAYYKENATLEELGNRYDLSRERIRQLIKRASKRLKRTAVQAYITGEVDDFSPTRKTDRYSPPPLSDSVSVLADVPPVTEDSITISEMAKRLSKRTEKDYGVKLRFSDVASWLIATGDMDEYNDNGTIIRLPTKQGNLHGIVLGRKINSAGYEYKGLFLELPAQAYISENIDELVGSIPIEEDE